MSERVLIHRGTPEGARALGRRLEHRGIAYVLEEHHAPQGRHRVVGVSHTDLLVDADDESQALFEREQWRVESDARSARIARRLGMLTVLSIVPAAAWLTLWLLAPGRFPEPRPGYLLALTVVAFVVFAHLDHRRQRSERIRLPR